jgi:F-type H+-transporting ATPase subunit epsilon
MNINVLTPDREILKGDIKSVKVPGVNGEFQILNNHAPIVSSLSNGKVTIVTGNGEYHFVGNDAADGNEVQMSKGKGETIQFEIEGGFIEVLSNEIQLLVTGVQF